MMREVWGMTCAGVIALVAGLGLARPRLRAVSGAGRLIVLAPVFEAASLAIFAMEHLLATRALMPIVPRWLPGPFFWTCLTGAGLMAAAVSLVAWRCVRWSAPLLALFFLLIVALVDLPGLRQELHNRIFWILVTRELSFGAGAMVLAGSVWPEGTAARALVRTGRWIIAPVLVFYAIEHLLHPMNVPGVPLEKLIPGWMPAPVLLSYMVGIVLLLSAPGLLFRRTRATAAAVCGLTLLLLTALFYLPIFLTEMRTSLSMEGINYVGDTLLFAATVMLAGFDAIEPEAPQPVPAARGRASVTVALDR